MKYNIVYVVIHEGMVEYASTDKDFAEEYAFGHNAEARQDILDEWGVDGAPTEKDIAEADFQAGFDGDFFEVVSLDISNLTKDDMVNLPDGYEIEVSCILEKLETSE